MAVNQGTQIELPHARQYDFGCQMPEGGGGVHFVACF